MGLPAHKGKILTRRPVKGRRKSRFPSQKGFLYDTHERDFEAYKGSMDVRLRNATSSRKARTGYPDVFHTVYKGFHPSFFSVFPSLPPSHFPSRSLIFSLAALPRFLWNFRRFWVGSHRLQLRQLWIKSSYHALCRMRVPWKQAELPEPWLETKFSLTFTGP